MVTLPNRDINENFACSKSGTSIPTDCWIFDERDRERAPAGTYQWLIVDSTTAIAPFFHLFPCHRLSGVLSFWSMISYLHCLYTLYICVYYAKNAKVVVAITLLLSFSRFHRLGQIFNFQRWGVISSVESLRNHSACISLIWGLMVFDHRPSKSKSTSTKARVPNELETCWKQWCKQKHIVLHLKGTYTYAENLNCSKVNI